MSTTPAERLELARETRSLITSEMRALANGDVLLREVLGNPQSVLRRCRLSNVLLNCPGFGRAGISKFFAEMPKKLNLHHDTPVGTLTKAEVRAIWHRLPPRVRERQRAIIADRFARRDGAEQPPE